MPRCEACGGPLEEGALHHPACLRSLFGRAALPAVDLSISEVSIRAQEAAGKLSISGAQPKLSMVVSAGRLAPATSGGRFILKPQTAVFPHLPENENACMCMAQAMGLEVSPHALVTLKDGTPAYLVRRFDRTGRGKVHCEDFAQILGTDKYSGSIEQVGKALRRVSRFPGLDAQFLFERVLLFYLVGNGDAHLKNFSVLYDPGGSCRLSPAYDIVSSKLVIPDEEELALALNGKHNRITVRDFAELARYLKIPEKAEREIVGRFLAALDTLLAIADASRLPDDHKQRLMDIIRERTGRLSGA